MDVSTKTIKVDKYDVDVICDDLYIRLCLERGYEWDQWMRSDLPHIYKPGTDIIDIGGNIGYNSLMYSDYGSVHTFEPLFHKVITKNISQNNLKNPVKVYPFGLSNEDSEILIYKPKPEKFNCTNYGGCSMTFSDAYIPEGIPVTIKKLDDVYKGTPSIMKIDVETHEYKVLLGAENTIRKHKPSMYIEIFDFEASPIVQYLKEMGYNTVLPRPENNYLFIHNP